MRYAPAVHGSPTRSSSPRPYSYSPQHSARTPPTATAAHRSRAPVASVSATAATASRPRLLLPHPRRHQPAALNVTRRGRCRGRRITRQIGRLFAVWAAVAALPLASASAHTSSTTHVPTGPSFAGSLQSAISTASSNLLYDGTAQLNAGKIPFPYQSMVPGHVTVVNDPINPGTRKVMRYAVADSDRPYSGASDPRADLETPSYFTAGSDLYYSLEFLIPQGFPALKSHGFFQISEVYGPPHGGSPPIGIDLFPGSNGRPVVSFERSAPYRYDRPWTGPTLTANWHTIVVHTESATNNTGFVELWFDGKQQQMSNGRMRINYPTLESGINWDGHTPNLLHINQYRKAGAYPGTVVTYQAAAKVGTTLASVMR